MGMKMKGPQTGRFPVAEQTGRKHQETDADSGKDGRMNTKYCGHIIPGVAPGSIGEELELEPGDVLFSSGADQYFRADDESRTPLSDAK